LSSCTEKPHKDHGRTEHCRSLACAVVPFPSLCVPRNQLGTNQLHAHKGAPGSSKFQHLRHTRDVRGYNYTRRNYLSFGHGLYVNFAVRRDYSSPAARALRQPRRAPRVLVSTLPAAATTSPTPRVRVPRHVVRLVTRLVAPPIVDYSTARPSASARRAARHVASRAARRQLLRLAQACRRLLLLAQARRRLLRAPRLRLAATLALLHPRRAS
jgi:hypothetical protein